jgi:hypothetical protein
MRTLHVIVVREIWDMYHPLGHMCNLANNIAKLERGGDWFEPVHPFPPISPQFFLFVPPFQLSNQVKKYS